MSYAVTAPRRAFTSASRPPPRHDLHALKEGLRIFEVWQRLGLPGAPAKMCRSPFRPDRTPSFSIHHEGRRWKDFGTGEGGDVIDFIAHACQIDPDEAIRRFLAMAGVAQNVTPSEARRFPFSPGKRAEKRDSTGVILGPHSAPENRPSDPLTLPALHTPTEAELQAVADSRGLDVEAIALAHSLRTLVFGTVCGAPCWILTDDARRIAEARRIDRQPFAAIGSLGTRKAHTLRGSSKAWPLGLALLQRLPRIRALMLVEGGPDYLAALHFCLTAKVYDVLPIAMLGRSVGGRLDPAALALLKERQPRIRIYPHADADGGGVTSAQVWAAQLRHAGCEVDWLTFDDLTRADGQPVKDLNDAALALAPAHPSRAHAPDPDNDTAHAHDLTHILP